jgi:hypothetical protein
MILTELVVVVGDGLHDITAWCAWVGAGGSGLAGWLAG